MAEESIYKILAQSIGVPQEDIEPKHHLIDDLGADSLTTVEIVLSLEEEFDIDIEDSESEELFTVQDILDYMKGRL